MKPLVVLDKSFIRGAPGRDVSELCESARALMAEDLFFELVTGDLETRTKCFRKFPARENPVAVVPNVGTLMSYETENRRPCAPIWEHRMPWVFTFNEELSTGDFRLTNQQAEAVRVWEGKLAEDVEGFVARGGRADRLFPALRGLKPGQHPEKVEELLTKIASDMEGIREIYRAFSPNGFPPASIVGRTWALFRWVQVHCIGVVEFFAMYGDHVNPTRKETLENERTDLNYLILAVLAGGLATRDATMARRFRLLCSRGQLIS